MMVDTRIYGATHRAYQGIHAHAWRMSEYRNDADYIKYMSEREHSGTLSLDVIEKMIATRRRQRERLDQEHYLGGAYYEADNDDGEDWKPTQFGDLGHAIRVATEQAWQCSHERNPLNTHRIGDKEMCRVCRRRRIRAGIKRAVDRKRAREAIIEARIAAKKAVAKRQSEAQKKIVISDAQAAINARGRLPLDDLKRAVAAHFGISVADIVGKGRSREFVHARAVIVQILLERGCSYPVIGRSLGGRDHSSAIHSKDHWPIYVERDPKVGEAYNLFRDKKAVA